MDHLELLYKPAAVVPEESKGRLVVVSNRVPTTSAAPAAGGLAVALEAALKPRGGLWFGWSGEACKESEPVPQLTTKGSVSFAVSGLSRRDIEQYYCGFANRALWPGAAHELKSALIVNPYDIEATAAAIARALTMPLEERKDRRPMRPNSMALFKTAWPNLTG